MATRPEPVLSAATIGTVVKVVVLVLGFLGFANASHALDGETQTIVAVVGGAVTVVADMWAAFHARAKVTPLTHPVADDGTPLGKVTDLAEHLPADA